MKLLAGGKTKSQKAHIYTWTLLRARCVALGELFTLSEQMVLTINLSVLMPDSQGRHEFELRPLMAQVDPP